MGQFGRIEPLSDLPAKRTLAGYLKKAMKLNEEGVKVERPKAKPKGAVVVPKELERALQRSNRAL